MKTLQRAISANIFALAALLSVAISTPVVAAGCTNNSDGSQTCPVTETNLPATVATGTGAQGASSPRVTVATDSATVAGSATLPAGSNIIGQVDIDQTTPGTTNAVFAKNNDPCFSAAKSSVAISVTSATTTSLVAVSGSTAVYICGYSMTIAPSATSADTAQFEYGTGGSCTGTHALTGTYGNGDLTSAAPVVPIVYGGAAQTLATAPSANGVCVVTAGTAVNVQGILTYVQQ